MQELTAKDITSIIRACKDSNIQEFKYKELEISFGAEEKDDLTPQEILQPSVYYADSTPPKKHHFMEAESEQEYEDDYQLAVIDPVAWEEEQLKEEEKRHA